MLSMLMALSFVVSQPGSKNVASHQVASPEKLGIYKHQDLPYTLKPQWQVTVITSRNGNMPIQSVESNLEHWRNLVQPNLIDEMAPKQAVLNPNAGMFRRIRQGFNMEPPFRSHCPWQSPILRYLPEFKEVGTVLYFELVAMPSIRKPYYEGIVSVMPTIRCKAKTIELLQEQLLQQYSQYLAKMLQDEEDFPNHHQNIRPESQGLNGAFIAWLIGATHEEKKPKLIQIFSFSTDFR